MYTVKVEKNSARVKLAMSNPEKDDENFEEIKKIIKCVSKNQAFRLTFSGYTDMIYAFHRFFTLNNLDVITNIVVGDKSISKKWSEKPKDCSGNSLFEYIQKYFDSNGVYEDRKGLYTELEKIDYLKCDDAPGEKADFIGISSGNVKRLILIHCKSYKGSGTGASYLERVLSQAVKNLLFLNRNINENIRVRGKKIYKNQKIKKKINFDEFNDKLKKLREDPLTEKEVWVVMAGGLIASQLKNKPNDPRTVLAKYILYSTWASVSSANARFKVFCPEDDS